MSRLNQIVSSDNEPLILVTPDDECIGSLTKRLCHEGEGQLHRAFSVFIFNKAGDVLLQKRSAEKMLWPLHWSNACCSHPRAGEESGEAAHRRLKQELGISASLTFLYKFQYQAGYRDVGSENELCWVWLGTAEAEEIKPNRNEIAEWRYFTPDELDRDLTNNPDAYTPWMKMEWQRILANHANHLDQKELS